MKINKFGKTKSMLVIAAQILVLVLLTACTTVEASGPATACRATGDPANPYEVITITNYIFPAPANGCPTGPVAINEGKIAICHATGSETNPYNKITVSVNGLNGHGAHEGDVFPAADGNCPASAVVNGDVATVSTVCHAPDDATGPYTTITVNKTELDQHCEQYPSDINPAPVNGCPTGPVIISNGKIAICHATGSAINPYTEITVSVNGLNGHGDHEGDIIPAPEIGCPTAPVVINNGKITICHATGSEKNPYNEITVSANGLNGHDKHEGDLIPAPAGGCP